MAKVVYAFSVFMDTDKPLPGFPAAEVDVRKALPDGIEFTLTPPVVGLIFKCDHQLAEDELAALVGNIQGALEKRQIPYSHLDLTGAQQVEE